MSMRACIGQRWGALLGADKDVVRVLGYGVYLGDMPCPVGPFGMSLAEYHDEQRKAGVPVTPFLNPCIRLDNGRHVWGFQCWHGSEEKIKAKVAQYPTIQTVEIEDLKPLENP